MITTLKTYLIERLKQELPGKSAHAEMTPYRNVNFKETDVVIARRSGVLILFYAKKNEPHIVLIQRPKYEGKHSGQVAFPGGKHEETDKDIIYTALREANEEVGIMMDDVEVIGQLSEVFIPVSNFVVAPVIGFINYHPKFNIDNYEVEELIELKLEDLTTIKELSLNKIILSNNTIIKVPSFEFNNKIIWGATALMLNELRYILLEK